MQQLTTEPARPLDTGELHAFNLTGTREILGTGEFVGRATTSTKPAGTVDTWGTTQRRALRHPPQGHRGHRVPRS